jgi:hypothetical protein
MTELADYYQAVGFFRASGLDDAQAYHRADEVMEATMGPNEWNMQNILTDALATYADEAGKKFKVRTYEDTGMLTRDKGLVVEVEGSKFQITIVQV